MDSLNWLSWLVIGGLMGMIGGGELGDEGGGGK